MWFRFDKARQKKKTMTELEAELADTRSALEKSVSLQTYYACLLNAYDGGGRIVFANGSEWMKRVKEVEASKLSRRDEPVS